MFTVSFRRKGIPWFSVNVLAPNARMAREAAMNWYLSLHAYEPSMRLQVSNA